MWQFKRWHAWRIRKCKAHWNYTSLAPPVQNVDKSMFQHVVQLYVGLIALFVGKYHNLSYLCHETPSWILVLCNLFPNCLSLFLGLLVETQMQATKKKFELRPSVSNSHLDILRTFILASFELSSSRCSNSR